MAAVQVAEPTISCPHCRAEIKLTESLAAPLIAATKADFEKRLAAQSAEVAMRDREIQAREEQLAKEKESLDTAVAEKVKAERDKLAADAAKRDKALTKREEQITRVLEATVGMYGELQGIAGKSLLEIEGLEVASCKSVMPA
jgi:hypothetical protein